MDNPLDHTKELTVLFIAGFFGSLVRLVLNPEPRWQRWLVRFTVGVSCAVFLGGVASEAIAKAFSLKDMEQLLSASGFICGVLAEQMLEKMQARMNTTIETR